MALRAILVCLEGLFFKKLPPAVLERGNLNTKNITQSHSYIYDWKAYWKAYFSKKKLPPAVLEENKLHNKKIETLKAILVCLEGIFSQKKLIFTSSGFRRKQFTNQEQLRAILACLEGPEGLFFKSPPAVLEGSKLHTQNDSECHSGMFTRHLLQKKIPLAVLKGSNLYTKNEPESHSYIMLARPIFKKKSPPAIQK